MPIDPDVAVGAALPEIAFSWTESDVLLYHLAIGAGAAPGDNVSEQALRWTVEGDRLQVLPSFGIVSPTFHLTEPPPLELPGCDINLSQVLHGTQSIDVHRPIPTRGAATVATRITDVWDKGKAAVIVQEGTATAEDGSALWTTRSSIFVRGEGGWGGDRGPSSRLEAPAHEPDLDASYRTTPQQALLYRLCGDRNPLHSEPAFAKAAGFPAPILHGLCSYGIALRTVVDGLLDGDAAQVRRVDARFTGIVFPGEAIRVRAWADGAEVRVEATVADGERAGSPVLSDCVVSQA